jgi:hypothetical protein
MNLSNFVWMLQNESLYFCRCDRLGDPYEGYYTQAVTVNEAEYVYLLLANEQFASLPNAETLARQAFKQHFLDRLPKSIRAEIFVSCWHMNEEESSAMWKLYTSHDESICIRSTYQVLAEVLPDACLLGQVKYIDYRKDTFDVSIMFNYILHKRKSFEHEHEARAIVWNHSRADLPFKSLSGEGFAVPIELRSLIKEIFVSPGSKAMLRDVVEGLATKYGLTVQVRQSTVNDPPTY